jgi:8-oxo-dGTP pyrophosphatase MutT (NUDIX family)
MTKEHDYYQLSLKVIMTNDNNEILALGGMPNGSYAGFYDLPGGRVDKDEFTTPLTDILKREIKEELGEINYTLKPEPVAVGRHLLSASISGLPEDVHVLYLFFEAKFISGEIKISDEHLDYKWFDLTKHKPSELFKSGNLEGINMYLVGHRMN